MIFSKDEREALLDWTKSAKQCDLDSIKDFQSIELPRYLREKHRSEVKRFWNRIIKKIKGTKR